ncbi:HemK2/MTQ2 family protein methyltransferase [Nonomuraea typhae]|uniref:HemK2/MTQ2 family protein methyltransferase n=1 Tax=Nonomuraea typhae TaxID=2603600 RepID=UPI0012F92984|nr:HemK2/MTQ2 family protein methyltransferase [Nonomuraea typhae]
MFLLRPPGVYRPKGDTALLAAALAADVLPTGARVLDLCTGTGVLALCAARGGHSRVTAVDLSWRAVLAARINALAHGLRVRVMRGSLFAPIGDEVFDLIVANPPYEVGSEARPGRQSRARAWDAGLDGRRLLDEICAGVAAHLRPGGRLLIVQSALSGVAASLSRLRAAGLRARVAARKREAFGPVMWARAAWLEEQGLILPGQRYEELVVIRADRSRTPQPLEPRQ